MTEGSLYKFLPKQKAIMTDYRTRYLCYAGGLGVGKTFVAVRKAFDLAMKNPRSHGWYVAPTPEVLQQVSMSRFFEFLELCGLFEGIHFTVNRSFYFLEWHLRGMQGTRIYFKAASNWKRWIGAEIGWSIFEEPAITAKEADKRLNERIRCNKMRTPHQCFYAGTPDIVPKDDWYFQKFSGETFLRLSKQKNRVRVVHARSDENPHRVPGYLTTLFDNYGHNKNLIKAYVFGQFVVVAEGLAYENFVENVHMDNVPVNRDYKRLDMMWDFNVNQTCWSVGQIIDGMHRVTGENEKATPGTYDACIQFTEKFPPYDKQGFPLWRDHLIVVNGDASGYQSDTTSKHLFDGDYDLIESTLKQYYSQVVIEAPRNNPYVRRRIEATNRILSKKRTVIDNSCQQLRYSLTKTTRDDLKKEKSKDTWTHPSDGYSYWLTYHNPIEVPGTGGLLLM